MVKIKKEEWEEFLKWKESKQRSEESKAKQEEEETLEIEDDLIEEWFEEEKEESEEYICGNCGYKAKEVFEKCPQCGKKLRWD